MTRKKVQAEEIKAADILAEVQVAEQDIEKVEETNVVPEGAPVAEGEIPAETEQKTEAPQTEEEGWQPFALEKRRLIHEFTEEDNNVLNEKIADLAEKEIEMDEKVKSYQAILKGTTTEKKEALKLRAEGYEEREFECPVLVNYKLGKKIVKHPETGEIITNSLIVFRDPPKKTDRKIWPRPKKCKTGQRRSLMKRTRQMNPQNRRKTSRKKNETVHLCAREAGAASPAPGQF